MTVNWWCSQTDPGGLGLARSRGPSWPAWTLLVLGLGHARERAQLCIGGYRPLPTTSLGTPEELLAQVGRASVVVMAELAELFGPWGSWPGDTDPPLLQVYPPQGMAAPDPSPWGHILFPFLSWLDQSPRDQHPHPHPQVTPLSLGSLCTLCKKI